MAKEKDKAPAVAPGTEPTGEIPITIDGNVFEPYESQKAQAPAVAPGTVRMRLLSDTPKGRDLPYGLNGTVILVTAKQLEANGDILEAV